MRDGINRDRGSGRGGLHTGVGRQRGALPWPRPRRIATLSVHTSPLHQPGTGDAGGMNVYILEVARRLAEADVEVEIFTRATAGDLPPVVEVAPGVSVRHVTAGPLEGLTKEELPGQLCAFTAGVLRAEAARPPGHYDLIHSHYWLSGQVGWLAKERWGVPLVHTAHTLAKVKNARLAAGDRPEPKARVIGEEQVVTEADRLVANTRVEARDLLDRYAADPDRVAVVEPGVDLDRFRPAVGDRDAATRAARRRLGLPADGYVVAFVGRIQPLKAPDVLVRAAAALRERDPALADELTVVICGGPSGSGLDRPDRADRAGARARRRRPGAFPAAADRRGPARPLPRRRPGRGAVAQRVVRPGRAGGPGVRHAGAWPPPWAAWSPRYATASAAC